MNIYLIYIVTALGVLLSLFWMLFMFLGKSIAGTDDKPQTIVYGKLEVKTSSVVGVLTASLLTAVLPLILQFYLVVNGISVVPPPEFAKATCDLLRGDYKLRFSYIFAEKGEMRLIARKGILRADVCEPSEGGEYILRGGDTTQFEVEFLVNKQYQLAAAGDYHYASEIRIDKDGKLISRTFAAPVEEHPKPKYYYNELLKKGYSKNLEEFKGEIDDALGVRNAIHIDRTTRFCDATVGKGGGRVTLAFICHDYPRVMVKISNRMLKFPLTPSASGP